MIRSALRTFCTVHLPHILFASAVVGALVAAALYRLDH